MTMTAKIINLRPPRVAMSLLALAAAVHLAIPSGAVYVYSSRLLAPACALIGFAIMMWAWWQFRQHRTAICPSAVTTSLITHGIYRFTRNPMYLGMLMMLLGTAVFFGTLPFYLAGLIFFAVIDVWFCRYEERKLLALFGSRYQTYMNYVRRWI